ncbi:MAG TPA: DUF2817 domain-containing protein [Bdellovibrionales bacterium]|nr:DUF2817 domain-containing protein [Bdellovibrionales bacterium]
MSQSLINRRLPELATLERLLKTLSGKARVQVEATVRFDQIDFPIHSITFGSEDKSAPCLGVFGGVHGLERIGSEVVISWLQTMSEVLNWDETFQERLKHSRIVLMPIVNPIGMYLTRRSNGNGVDLMRNAPVTADEPPAFLLGGQTYSNLLPWYRGNTAAFEQMEIESQALCNLVQREVFPSKTSLTVDVHSGFGAIDRLWFPYAKSKKPPPHLLEITAMKRLFDRSYPNHFYRIEPQAKQYTTHGDLWDWLYDAHMTREKGKVYIPWTLELGSWVWLKKNPRQLFSSLGAFNPVQPHRLQRILRRHLTLFDFLHRAVMSPKPWTEFDQDTRRTLQRRAMDLWYDPDR